MECFGTYFTHVQTCDDVRVQSATEWTASVHTLHYIYFTHVQTCDDVRVQSATEWTASVHTLHMSKPVMTFVSKVLRNGLLHPQFAYLPLRSTREALLRVAAHCEAVRHLLQTQVSSINLPRHSQPRLKCCGGIQIFLDLHRAFDQLPRPLILEALQRMPLSHSLLSLLTHWHLDTSYHLHLNNSVRQVPVTRGVRQGCCTAPFIWASVISLVLSKLESTIPLDWLQRCITIYADDFHIACIFTSEDELQLAMTFIGHILDELARLDFILSPHKSSVIIRGNGSRFDHWKKKHISTDRQGTRCLFVETSQGQTAIPIQRKCTYLGCLVSYGNFELMTLKMRLATGWHLFRRLQKWLCSRQRAHLALRLRLFKTCVLPCITYGLMYMGLTHQGIQQLCIQITAMYRRVIGNKAHVTGMTHADFNQHYHLSAPAAILNDLWHQALTGLTNALTQTPAHDIIHQTCWGALHRTRSSLDRLGSGPVCELLPPQALTCPHCDACFQHPNLLQRHLTRNHQCPRQVQRRLNMQTDSQDGKAICKHCNKSFPSWTSFKFHIQTGICLLNQVAHNPDDIAEHSHSDDQALDHRPPPNSTALGDRAYAIAQSGDYELAKEDQALCTYLTQHCVLCNKFMSSSRNYTYHMRHYHQAALQDAISLGLQLADNTTL